MSKLSLDLSKLGGTIEGDAADVLKFLTSAEVTVTAKAPKAIAALTVAVGAIKQFLADGETGNLVAALQQVKPVIGDVEDFIATL
jgi:hypothetical protein